MIVYAAGAVIEQMGANNEHNSRQEQPCFVLHKELLQHQESKTGKKKKQGNKTMVVFSIAMIKRIRTDPECQRYHTNLEPGIMDDIQAEQGKAGEE